MSDQTTRDRRATKLNRDRTYRDAQRSRAGVHVTANRMRHSFPRVTF